MKFEVHYTKIVEADDFFDAVELAKELENVEEVISICPCLEEDMILKE